MSSLIPDKAWDVVAKVASLEKVVATAGNAWDTTQMVSDSIEAAAPHIIAAELDRLRRTAFDAPLPDNVHLDDEYAYYTDKLYGLIEDRIDDLRGES